MKQPIRIATVISAMQAGGAERVLSRLLNYWAEEGWMVTAFTFEPADSIPFYALDPRVNYRPLGLAGFSPNILEAFRSNCCRLKGLRQALRQASPQMVLSFCAETNVATLLAASGLKVPVVVSERADPALHHIGRAWRWGRRWLYPRAKFIVVQTQEAGGFFSRTLRPHLKVIPNPVARQPFMPVTREKRLLAVGRLEVQKGFDLLLPAFAQARTNAPDWRLRLIGEGGARDALVSQAKHLGLSKVVEFPGLSQNIEREYAEAGAFVLSSRYEGFPNALCEAMAAGMAVVAFACRGGVKEIVIDNVNGLLAPPGDIAALAEQLTRVMVEEDLRQRLGKRALDITVRFSAERILKEWTNCMQATLLP